MEKNQAFILKEVTASIDGYVLDSIPPVELVGRGPIDRIVERALNSHGLELPMLKCHLGIKTKEGLQQFSFKPLTDRKSLDSSSFSYFREQSDGFRHLMTQAHYYGNYNYNFLKKAGILRIEKSPDEESIVIETNKNRELPWMWLISLGYKKDKSRRLYSCEFGVNEIFWNKDKKIEYIQDEFPYKNESLDLDTLTQRSKLIRNARNYNIERIPVTNFKEWEVLIGLKDSCFVERETERLVDMYLKASD